MENNLNEETIYSCPNCGNTITLEDEHCSKCGVKLTFETDNADNDNTIVIRTFSNEFEAQIAKGILEEEGIESFITKDDEGSMTPSLQLTQGVNLHIFEKDQNKAVEILNALNS